MDIENNAQNKSVSDIERPNVIVSGCAHFKQSIISVRLHTLNTRSVLGNVILLIDDVTDSLASFDLCRFISNTVVSKKKLGSKVIQYNLRGREVYHEKGCI